MEQHESTWRWLESSPEECRSGRNLRIDQAIFEAHREDSVPPTIRLYRWNTPVVSIGRLQAEERVRGEFPTEAFVRRTTGGLAVKHGDDLTVTIVVSEAALPNTDKKRSGNVLDAYFVLLSGMINALREVGIDAKAGSEAASCPTSTNCFDHLGPCDVFDARTNQKILGSAQRRAKGFLLQQMSLPPLPGLDIHSAPFYSLLKRHYEVSLRIEMWQNETVITNLERERVQRSECALLKEL